MCIPFQVIYTYMNNELQVYYDNLVIHFRSDYEIIFISNNDLLLKMIYIYNILLFKYEIIFQFSLL